MYKLLTKYGQLFAFGLALIVIALFLGSALGGLDGFAGLSKEDRVSTTIFDLGLKGMLALLVICAALAVLWGLFHMITNPKNALKGIIALAVIGILFFILYNSSEAETSGIVGTAAEKFDVTESQSKIISAGLKTMLILSGLTAASFVLSEVRNFFK